ncbi:MAG: glycosyltransferase family 2 protein, partial [Anaerolineae bacterium]|nr:glycosyltransferase family 2 protein [Anaerolineae bacterium]
MPVRHIAIVILNWNGLDDTLRCLGSLAHLNLPDGVTAHILLIDNGSDTDPSDAIRQQFPHVQMTRNAQNLGFAGGCNVGMRMAMAAGADAVLLLNNDTVVSPDFLAQLLSATQGLPQPVIAAPIIYDMQQRDQVTFAGGNIDFGRGKFGHQTDIQKLGFLKKPNFSQATSAVSPHDYVTGCAMLIPRAVIERIGLLEVAFFAYCEDVEYCVRAQRHGIASVVVHNSHIWHDESSSTRRGLNAGSHSPLKHYLLIRNQIRVVKQYAPTLAKWRYFGVHLPLRAAYYSIGFIVRRRWAKMRAFWQGVGAGLG